MVFSQQLLSFQEVCWGGRGSGGSRATVGGFSSGSALPDAPVPSRSLKRRRLNSPCVHCTTSFWSPSSSSSRQSTAPPSKIKLLNKNPAPHQRATAFEEGEPPLEEQIIEGQMETEKRDAKQVADLEDEREKLEKLVVKPLFARCVMSNTKPDFSSVEEQYLQRKCLPFKTHASLWQNETKLPKAFIAEMNKWNRAANGTASGDGKLVKWSKKELEMLTEFDPKLYAPDGSTPAPTAEKFEEDPTFTAQQVRDYGKALLEVEKSCLDYYYAEGKQVGGVVEVRNAYDLSKLPRRCFEGAKAVAPKTGGEEVVDSEIDDGDRAYRFEFYKYREDTSKLSALDRLKLHCRSHCLFGVEKCKEVFQKSAFQLAKDTVTDTANAVGDLGTALKNGGRTDTALSAGASPAMRRAQRWVCDKYAKIVAARKSTPAWTPEGRAMAELSDDEIWKQAEKEGEELFSGVDFAPPKPEEENPDGPDAGAEGAPATTPASGAGVGADNQPEPPEDKIAKRVEIPVPADPAVSLTDDILRSAYESAYFHAYGHKPTSGAETAASAVANGVKQLFGSMMELSKTGLNAGKQNACKMLGKLAGTSDAPIIEQPSPNELARKLLEKIMADKKEREISLKLFGAAGQWETKKAIYGLMHQYKSPGEDNCAPNYTVSVDDPAYARWKQVNEAKIALEKEALDGAAHPEKTRTGHGRENGVSAAAAKQMEKLGALTSKGGIAEAEERFNSEGTLRTLKISIRPLKKDGVLNFQKCKYPTDLKKKLAEALGVEAERVVMPREGNKVNKRGDRLTVQYAVKEKPISKEPPKPAPGPDPCAGLLEAMCKAPPPISPPHVDAIFRSERPAEMLARELVDDGADSCFHHVRAHVQKRGYETRAWVELRVPKVEIFQDVNGGVVKTGDKVQIFDEEDFSARFPFSVGKFAGATNAQPFAPENGVDAKMYAGGGDEKFLRVWPAKQGVIDLSQPPVLVPARLVVKHETGGFRSGDLARVRPEFEEDAVEGERKAPGTGADDATGGADVEMAAAGGATTGANGATSGLQIGTKRLRTKFQDVGTAAGGAAGQDDETGPPPVPPISSKQQLHNALDNAYVQVVRPPDYSVPNPTATVRLVRPVRVKNLPDFDIERMVTEARDEYFGLHTKVKNTTNKLAPQHCMDGWRPFSPEFAGLRKEPQNVVAGSGTGSSADPGVGAAAAAPATAGDGGGGVTGASAGATSVLQIGTKRLRTKFQDADEIDPTAEEGSSSAAELNATDSAGENPPPADADTVKNDPLDVDIPALYSAQGVDADAASTAVGTTTGAAAGAGQGSENIFAGSEIPSADYSVENGALGENATLHLRCGADFPRPRDAFCKGGRCNEMDNYTCCGPPTNNQSCLSATECDPCIHVQHQDEPDQVESRGFCVATGSEALKMICQDAKKQTVCDATTGEVIPPAEREVGFDASGKDADAAGAAGEQTVDGEDAVVDDGTEGGTTSSDSTSALAVSQKRFRSDAARTNFDGEEEQPSDQEDVAAPSPADEPPAAAGNGVESSQGDANAPEENTTTPGPTKQEAALLKQSQQQALEDKRDTSVPDAYHTEDRTFWKNNEAWLQGLQITFREPGAPAQDGAVNTVSASEDLLAAEEARASGHPQVDPDGMDAAESAAPADTSDAATSSSSALAVSQKRLLHPSAFQDAGTTTSSAAGDAGGAAPAADEEPPPVKKFYGPFAGKHAWLGRYFPHTDEYELFFDEPLEIPAEQLQRSRLRKGVKMHVKLPEGTEYDATLKGFSHGTHPTSVSLLGTSAAPAQLDLTLFDYTSKKIPLQYAHESEAYTCPAVGAEAEPEGGGGGQANDGAATGNAQTAGAAGADADTDETRRDAAVERALAAATKNLPCVKVVPFTEGEKKQKLERARKTIMRRELIKYAKCDFGAAPVRKMIAARLQGKLAKPNDNRFNPDANDRTLDVFFHGYADAYWRRIRDEMKLSNPFSADSFFKSIPTVTRKELQQRGYPSIVADFEGKGVISGDKACRIKTFKTMDKNNAEAAEELGAVSEEEEERAAAAETAAAEEKHAAEDPEIAAEKNKTLLERLADGIRVKEDEDGKPLKDAHGEELKPLTGEALVSDPGHLYREAARRMVFENFLRMGRPLPPATHELAVRAEQPHPQPHPHEQAPAAPPAAPEGEDAPSEGAEGAAANGETSDEEKKLQQEEEGLTDAFSNLLNAVASKMHAGTVSLGSKLGSTAVGQMVLKNGLEARDVLASILPKAEKDCPPIPATPLALFAKDEYAHRGQVVNYGNGPAGEVSLGYLYFRRRHADFAENIVERLKRVTVKHLDKNIKHELLMENPKKVAKVRDEAEKCRRKNGGMKKLEEDEENYQQDDTSDDGGEGNGGGAEMQGADGGMDMHVDAAKKIAADADVEFAIAPSNPVESGPSLADNADENNLAVHQNEAAKAAEGEEGDEGADEGGPSGPAEAGDSAAREDREPMDRYLKLLFLRARNEDFRAAVHEVAGDVASKCRGETSRPLLLQRAFEAMNGIPEEKAMLCRPKVGKCEAITEPKQCVEAKLCRLQFAKCVVQDLKNATAADERECGGRTTEEECASASGGAEDVADEPEAADEDPVGSETEPPKAANKPNASPLCQWKEFQCRTQTLNARKLAREPWNRNAQMYFGCQTLAHEECEASQDYCEWNSGLVCRKKLPLAEGEEDGATEDTEKADTATAAVTAASPANESAPEPCRLAILGSQENVEKACGAHVGENVCTVEPAPGVEHRYIERFLPPLENAPLMLNEGPKNEHTEHRNEDNWPMLRELAVVPEKTLIQVKGVQKSLEKFFKIVLDEALESDQEKVNAGTKALDAAQQEETGAPASKSAGKSTMSKLREAAVASGSLAGMNVLERNELENLAQDRAVALLQYFEPDIERDMIRGITNRLGPARTPDFAWALERDMRFFNEMRDSATEAAFMDRLLRAFQVFRNLPSSGVAGIQDAMAVAKEDVTWFVTKKMAPKVKGAPSHFSMDDIVTKMQKLIQKAMSSMACVILDPIEAKIQVHGTAVMDTLLPLLTSFWGNMAAIALMFTVQRMGSNSDYETQSNWFGTDLTDVVGDTRENPDYDNDMSSKKFFPGVWNAVQTDVCQTLSADQCEHVEPCVKVPIPAPKGKKGKETTSRLEDDESTKHYTCMNREEAASAIVSETGEKASLPVGDRFFGVTKTNGRMPDWAFDWDFEKPVNPTLILPEVIKNAKLRDRIVAEGEAGSARTGGDRPQSLFESTTYKYKM